MQDDNSRKWTRKLNKGMIQEIQKLEPDSVQFVIDMPTHVVCTIRKGLDTFRGLAICSVLDRQGFDVRKGKALAASRAIRACKRGYSSEPIRNHFPSTEWKPSQKKLLEFMRFKYGEMKSIAM